jgi:hypothetical protein
VIFFTLCTDFFAVFLGDAFFETFLVFDPDVVFFFASLFLIALLTILYSSNRPDYFILSIYNMEPNTADYLASLPEYSLIRLARDVTVDLFAILLFVKVIAP